MNFSDVNGGRGFKLGVQIDACGGYEDNLIIVECKTAQKDKKSLLDIIRIARGKIEQIESAVRGDPLYSKYSNIVHVIATNFKIRDLDEKEADDGKKIFLWDITFIGYYEELIKRIGEFSKYNLLGELGCSPRVMSSLSIPAFKYSISGVNLYSFVHNPKEILKFSYVARREIGKEQYYQRIVESSRLNSIASFINSGGFFPNSVIIAFGVNPSFTPIPEVKESFMNWNNKMEFGALIFPANYRACWIIDGQHRLYGMAKTSQVDQLMQIVAIEDIPIEKQAQLFLDINKNQKQVPSDLVWDLEGEMRPDSPEGIIARVAIELNKTGKLKNNIFIPLQGNRKKAQLKLTSICSAIKKRKITTQNLAHKFENPLFDNNPDATVNNVVKSLNEALEVLYSEMSTSQNDRFWSTNNGLVIFIALFERILEHKRKIPKTNDYAQYFKPLREHLDRYEPIDKMKSLQVRCSSEAGRDEVISEFIRAIRKKTDIKNFAIDVPEFEIEERIKKVERGLGNVMAGMLSKCSDNWFKQRVEIEIQNRVKETRNKYQPDPGPIQDYFTLGQIKQTVINKRNWDDLEGLFQKGGFPNLEDLQQAFSVVNRLRGSVGHGRSEIAEADELLLDGYLKKFEKIIQYYIAEHNPVNENE